MSSADTGWLVDGHVHLYRQHDLDRLLRTAHTRLQAQQQKARCALLVAAANDTVEDEDELRERLRGWRLEAAADGWLQARGPDSSAIELHFGRQIATRERLELLVFGRTAAPREGPMLELAERALDAGALVILPWGAGKWWGARGRLVHIACERFAGRAGFLLGDSAARPHGWRLPAGLAAAQRAGVPVVCGTDPMPVSGEEGRVGSYCFEVRATSASPANLIDAMRAPESGFVLRGRRASFVSFCRMQVLVRLRDS